MSTPTLAALEEYVWWLAIAGHLVLFLRLWRIGLHRIYRYFSAYLLFRVLRALILAATPPIVHLLDNQPNVRFGTNAYSLAWMVTLPVLWFFYILVVLELYSLVLQNYKGIASLSRWVLLTGLGVALAISSLTLATDLSNPSEQFPAIRTFLVIDRGVVSSLVIFLLFITGFLAWYPVPVGRNVVIHCVAYAMYFLSTTMVVLVRNLTGSEVTQTVNILLSCIMVACLAVWIVFLNRQGERKTVVLRRHWAAEEEEQLVQQLAAINSSLLRAGRK